MKFQLLVVGNDIISKINFEDKTLDKDQLNLALSNWGRWKRNSMSGMGWKNSGIEAQIIRGEIFGDGNVNGGRNLETVNGVNFKEDEISSEIDRCVKKMVVTNRELAGVLVASYVWQWSMKKISSELERSRYKCGQDLKSAKHVLNALIEYV